MNKFLKTYVYFQNGWHDLLQIWYVFFTDMPAPAQQFRFAWSMTMELRMCVRSYFVLRVNISTLCMHAPFSWAARHTTMCFD